MQQHPMAGQGHIPAAVPLHPPPPRRDYAYQPHHQQYYHHPPQSPIQPGYYYGHPPPQYRWQPPYPQPHAYPPPHMQQQYQPRSPMVVSSAPHHTSMTPVTRQSNPMPAPPQAVPSPRPIPPYMHQQPPPTQSLSPAPVAAAPPPAEEQRADAEIETPSPQSARRPSTTQNPLSLPPEHKQPFWPDLPWYSTPEAQANFPTRAPTRRRRRRNLRASNTAVALPTREESVVDDEPQQSESLAASAEEPPSETSTIAAPSEPETPATSQAPSESDFTQVSTPATPAQAPLSPPKAAPTPQQHIRRDTRTAIAVPNIPGFSRPKEASPPATVKQEAAVKHEEEKTPKAEAGELATVEAETASVAESTTETAPPKAAPKSWADLVRQKPKPGAAAAAPANGEAVTNGIQVPKSASLADALKQYNVRNDKVVPFLEPRGLVNTGNMCYMNSILQVLVFCVPFYNFLDQVRQRTVHSIKSDTPLVDATIMFMREFKVLASAESVEDLRSMLKQEQLEEYGEQVTPEYVYDVIRKLPRFAGMRRGQQQDAEEFLGFLLEGLHDECVRVMQGQTDDQSQQNSVTSPDTIVSPTSADGWQEVGPKQKASVTRTAGEEDTPSPVTKIFGGYLRSEFRVPGLKDSVTLEPYKPLQLDIGAAHVNNIVDALKGLTRTETMTGEFGGKSNTAKKQVFIDSLPPVLILHLKRFQYENSFSGTQKIWKKVGYPLELEIPKDVFPPGKRNSVGVKNQPKYRLISVVYHHVKSAAGGHYTVDVLRQDNKEWIRMDDTVIRRVRAEDVAEGGAEEDPKLLAKALEQHKADSELPKPRNIYQGLDEAEKEPEEEKPWSEVNGAAYGHAKKFSNAAITTNGTSTPTSTNGKRTPTSKREGVRDNKVAYILLYEQILD